MGTIYSVFEKIWHNIKRLLFDVDVFQQKYKARRTIADYQLKDLYCPPYTQRLWNTDKPTSKSQLVSVNLFDIVQLIHRKETFSLIHIWVIHYELIIALD